MGKIGKALEKAGLVPSEQRKPSHDQDALIEAWKLDDEPGGPEQADPEPDRSDVESLGANEAGEPPSEAESNADTTATERPAISALSHRPSGVHSSLSPEQEDFPGFSASVPASFEDKLIAMPSMDGQSVEQFRRLAAMLHLMKQDRDITTVLVSSALPGEGKTLTASNVALCLSGSYRRRVLLMDGDLRKPTLHELFHVPGASGLCEWLRSHDPEGPIIARVSRNLSIMPAGKPDPDPMGILTSTRMHELVDRIKMDFEWIILDSPPVGLLSDAHLLSAIADVVVLIVRAAYTPHADIRKAVDELGHERIAGVVLNLADPPKSLGRYDYYARKYYRGAAPGDARLTASNSL